MNEDRYKEVMEKTLVPFMCLHGSKFFLQDGAPCHKSKKVMAVLEGYREFSILDFSRKAQTRIQSRTAGQW
jgi:hypothetical protein